MQVNLPESGSWVVEDYAIVKEESLTGLKKLKDYLATQHEPKVFTPEISLFNEMGYDLGSNINLLVKDKKIDLVIMGTKGDDVVTHLFYGSEADDVLGHAVCPILFIPENYSFNHFNTIVFANDLKKNYSGAVKFLIDFARIDRSHVIITHFGEYDNNALKCLNFIENTLEYSDVTSRIIPLKNMDEQLRNFIVTVQADLLVMIHHHDIQLEKIITGSKSKRMLSHSQIPLLILPD